MMVGGPGTPAQGDAMRADGARCTAVASFGVHAPFGFTGLRRALFAAILTSCALVAALLLSAPALALSRQGHVFSSSFGAGLLSAPGGIAVNEETGVVYVSDRLNNRVDMFEAGRLTGTFAVPNPESIAVDNSSSGGDPSKGDVYVAGVTNKVLAQAQKQHRQLAEGEDTIVYKFMASGGEPIAQLKHFKTEKGESAEAFTSIQGIAIESNGELLVYDEEGEIAKFTNAAKNRSRFSIETGFEPEATRHGLAVDSAGSFYVGYESENSGAILPEGPPAVVGKCVVEEQRECEFPIPEFDQEVTTAVAVSPAGEVYVDNVDVIKGKKVTSVVAFNASGSVIQRFGADRVTEGNAVAVDSRTGEVFVTDLASNTVDAFALESPATPTVDSLSACVETGCGPTEKGLQLRAQVDPHGADTTAYFEYGKVSCSASCEARLPEPAKDLGSAFGDQALMVELPEEVLKTPGTYFFRAVAKNSFKTVTSPQHTFTITATVPEEHSTTLPDSRQWEMVSPVKKDGFEPEAIVPQGGTIQAARDGSSITYVADGPIPENGHPEGNRAPELNQIVSARGSKQWVSRDISTANEKVEGANVGRTQEYEAFSPELGLSLLQPFFGPGLNSQWEAPPLSPPVSTHEQELKQEGKPYQEWTIFLHDDAPLVPEHGNASEEASYAAAKASGEAMKNAGFLALATEANALGTLGVPLTLGVPFGGGAGQGIELLTATPDLSHAVFIKNNHGAPAGLYEWGPDGQLQLISVLPKNAQGEELPATTGALLPGLQPNMRNAMSAPPHCDQWEQKPCGSRVFWTNRIGISASLYVRDTETHESLQLDAVTSGSSAGKPAAIFQTASADGTKVFFTDSQRLTADSRAAQGRINKADLYVFELSRQGEPLSGTLRDLTPEGIHGESAAIQGWPTAGGVLGASEDGTYVYFVANGALAPGDVPGNCDSSQKAQAPELHCNLYVTHFNGTEWEAPKLITILSNDDSPDWGASGFVGDLGQVTSRVSPNGRYLAFMSERSLTGYPNEDVTSQAAGERVDEEVYLYDAQLDRLVCASCNHTGESPAGVFDPGRAEEPGHEAVEGLGLVVDRIGVWGARTEAKSDHWLAGSVPGWTPISPERSLYQARYLLDSGQLFFNSPDLLVPAVAEAHEKAVEEGNNAVSKEKVYEYEPNGVGECASAGGCIGLLSSPNGEQEPTGEHESAFLDASENGNDVFFLTAARLPAVNGVSQDVDSNFDVYDARVCKQGGFTSCLSAPPPGQVPCNEVKLPCKVLPPQPEGFSAPASASVVAPGNVARTQVLHEQTKKSPPRPLTRAQRLAKALKECRTHFKAKSKKKQRLACEARARKKYGAHKASKKAHHSSSRRHR
jgi:DNA-binding beta-propeller fold protein YncE